MLRLLVRFSPDNNHVDGIVQYLLKERSGGAWQNTHETAYAVLALTDYLLVEQQKQRATDLIIELNGQIYRRIRAENPNEIEGVEIPLSRLQSGHNTIWLINQSTGKLYYTVSSKMLLQSDQVSSAGLKVTRVLPGHQWQT